jgi:hypothetical protein
MYVLLAHHTKSYLGLDIEINDHPFPDGMIDHVLFFAGVLVMAYGIFAIPRDLMRLWRAKRSTGTAAGA